MFGRDEWCGFVEGGRGGVVKTSVWEEEGIGGRFVSEDEDGS